jgi:16S rRNA (cytosine967-C5)-methyltransferase
VRSTAQLSARALALHALRKWRDGRQFADSVLQELLGASALGSADRGFTTELFYGVLRNRTLLDFWISQLRSGAVDPDSRDLLQLGLYQLFLLRTPGHAAVYEAVALAPSRKRGFINAILRGAQRRSEELERKATAAPLAVRMSHPNFLLERWTRSFGQDASVALCEWNNQAAPIYARVNRLKIGAENFLSKHRAAEIPSRAGAFVRLTELPFPALEAGECYMQDPSTSVACKLLDPQVGETVLDACAAPGGKTALLAELMSNNGRLVACDRDPSRVATLRDNLHRLGVTIAEPLQHDWTSGVSLPLPEALRFDRILIDVPCTNTGVMRRRVDVRWRLRPEDFERMQREQLRIFSALVPLLKPGGTLVYSTCSIEPEENEQVVQRTIQTFPVLKLDARESVLPFREQFDGAFAARLVRSG